jgi:transposase
MSSAFEGEELQDTLQPQPILPVPEATAAVARAAFPNGNVYLQLRDELGTVYDDTLFTHLYPRDGQPAVIPWHLALVTVLQFAENLPDRQAADAVRSRIDWKYLLGVELTDPGFDYSVLCEFRARLVQDDATDVLLDQVLHVLKDKGILKNRGRQQTDSTHIVAVVRDLSRMELVGTTLLHTLNSLSIVAPGRVKSTVPSAWTQRYSNRWEEHLVPWHASTTVSRCSLGEP